MTKRNVRYKCPFCDARMTRQDLVIHIDDKHRDVLPEDFSSFRYVFNYVNRKPVEYHGKCTECGKPTPWDEARGKYARQCGSKQCHDSFVKRSEANNLRVLGVSRISQSIEGQEKMLANRKISGTYKMHDGVEKTYTGKYEHDALEFMDKVMNIRSEDIQCPGPVLKYKYKGEDHFYITDFYYVPYNLIIEVKDGGDRPNNRNMPEYRAKQIEKEKFIIKNTDYNYLRLTDNNLAQLLAVFADLKMEMTLGDSSRVIHVNEASGSLIGLPPVGFNSKGSCLIVNYMQNNVFSGRDLNGHAIADSIKLDKLITRDKAGKLRKTDGKKFLENCKYSLYLVENVSEEALKTIEENLDEFVEEGFIYETIFNKKLYTYDQIACDEQAKPVEDYYHHMYKLQEAIRKDILGEGGMRWINIM